MRLTHDTLAAYCGHPNVGAVLVVALGCEQVVALTLADAAKRHGKLVDIIAIQTEGGTVRATEKGIGSRSGSPTGSRAVERDWCDASELVLSLKCGGSDYTSGLASNPTLGRVTDRLVALGGARGARRDRRDHGRRASAGLARHAPRYGDEADPDHHPRRDRSAGARPRHPRHAAVARQHPRRLDDDRGEVAGGDAQGRRAGAARGRRRRTRRRSSARG